MLVIRKLLLIVITGIIIICASQVDKLSDIKNNEIEDIANIEVFLKARSERLPSSEENSTFGIKKYFNLLGLSKYNLAADTSIGGGNVGLTAHFQNAIEKNNCFARVAREFYLEIKLTDIERRLEHFNYFENRPLKFSPAITDYTGTYPYEKFPRGWLWQQLLKKANGDSDMSEL